MTAREFVAGDKIAFWAIENPEDRRIAWLAKCNDPQDGCDGLHLFSEYDPTMPFANFHDAVVDHPEMFGYELVTAFEDALPTEPGKYVENPFDQWVEQLNSLGLPQELVDSVVEQARAQGDADDKKFVWTLNEDGTWTDSVGTTKPTSENWQLAVFDYQFVKVEDGEAQPFA